MTIRSAYPLCVLLLIAAVGSGCQRKVSLVDPDTNEMTATGSTTHLTGKWNDSDSKYVAEKMIDQSFGFPWLENFTTEHNRKPVIRLDRVTVRSDGEIINTDIFLNDIRREYINSGKVTVVSSFDEADITRRELREQDVHASDATRKQAFQETGADFILSGTLGVQNEQEGRREVRFYQVDLVLTHVQTREQVWLGSTERKKFIETSRFR